ncbi:phosphotransferase family protein [Deinococcus roseus]|uniref:Aminoglycoside phosphotransferase domain-containing protein n=1 Tax=Deinococcus roseus TaxID=392414 RepID=A0ABQ2D004_9DEIO|nr:aminoglycoside phosphotransferase family protein [Deinococcus roseus]GGJ34037.1 hypothetical protein GCM10008938_20300 [Deinococcus roseus]
MQLPDFPDLTPEILQSLLEQHQLAGLDITPLPQTGIFNRVYDLGGKWILRIPRNAPPFIEALTKESVAVPALTAAGVTTPELRFFDGSLQILPVPYSIYEKVNGVNLESLQRSPAENAEVWEQVGRELVKVHHLPDPTAVQGLHLEDVGSPEDWIEGFATDGHFTLEEARWLQSWVARLKPYVLPPEHHTFRHGDMQGTNVMVDSKGEFAALIDWGACGWGDPAHDLVGVPLQASQNMLEAYRKIQPLPDDETAEARILLMNLQHLCFLIPRPALKEVSWAERPMSRWLDMVRHVNLLTSGNWKKFL